MGRRIAIVQKRGNTSRLRIVLFIAVTLICCAFLLSAMKSVYHTFSRDIPAVIVVPMENDVPIRQEIRGIPRGQVTTLSIAIATYERENAGSLEVNLYEDQDVIASWTVDTAELVHNQYKDLSLEQPYQMKSDATYSFTVKETFEGDNAIALWTDTNDSVGYSVGDSLVQPGSIRYLLTSQNPGVLRNMILFSIAVLLILMALLFFHVDERIAMIVIVAVLLAAYVIVCPLGMAPDECVHFYRAYELAQGRLIAPIIDGNGGDILPLGIARYNDPSAVVDWNDVGPVLFPGAASYSVISYLPQMLGIRVASLFTNNAAAIFYGGKIGNALVGLLLFALSLYLSPYGGRVLFVIMCFPMTMQEMVCVAPDGFTITLSMFFLTYILRLAYQSDKVRWRDLVILTLAGFCLAISKTVYLVLLLLLFLIPASKFSSKKVSYVYRCGFIVICAVLTCLWLKFSHRYWISSLVGADASQQIKFLLSHVDRWIIIATQTLLAYTVYYIETMVGSVLGALTISTTQIVWVFFLMLFMYELLNTYAPGIDAKIQDIGILLFVFLAGSALVIAAMYVSWTAIGAEVAVGVQGRYFIPLMGPLVFAIIYGRSKTVMPVKRESGDRMPAYMLLLTLFLNGIALVNVLAHYI